MVVVDSFLAFGYDKIIQLKKKRLFISSCTLPIADLESIVFPKEPWFLTVGKPNMGPGMLIAIGLIIVSRSQFNFNNTFRRRYHGFIG